MSSYLFSAFGPDSKEIQSSLFTLLPGWEAVALGFGFKGELTELEAGKPKAFQAACLNQVLLKGSGLTVRQEGCGLVAEIPAHVTEILAEGPVIIDGCPVRVSACDNRVGLPVPGIYRFVLNDPEAVGNVQLFVQAFPKNMLGT